MNRWQWTVALFPLLAVPCAAADFTLVKDGQARCVVLVAPEVMAADRPTDGLKFRAVEAEQQRRRLRESARDLVRCLEKMSGAKVELLTGELPPGDRRLPVLVGERARKVFGPPGKKAPYRQGFRFVVSPRGVGLYGESDLAASYAVYELLDRLGCRWYLPGELGEVVPGRKTVALPEADVSSAPGTVYRGVWYADEAYRRRNRMGGLALSAGHALEFYVSAEDRKKHPEWRAEIGGKPDAHRLKWSSPTLADFLADKILAQHARDPQPSYSLSPDDGASWDESKDDTALDAGDFDPTFQKVSKTDRLMVLCNRVAARVAAKDPEVLLGVLAYADYTRPPVREKVHPNLVPQLAPITYSRAHPMTDDRVPGNKALRYLIEGWGKKARSTSMYFYGWFLAEPSAPNPMTTKWGTDVPIVLKNNCRFWQPETLPNFETSMHGLYLGNRLAWDPSLRPADVIDELHRTFYGNAAKEMAAYWTFIDRVWVDTPEYSGCGFAYLRRWTPERLAEARHLLDAARSACQTPAEKARVRLADDSLSLFEQFMKLRRDQAEVRFASLAEDAARWRKRVVELGERYKDNYCFTRVPWTPHTVNGAYFGQFYQQTYDDASRVARHFDVLTAPPLRTFRYRPDPDRKGEAAGWMKPDFADRDWKTTDVCTETWSTLGHHDYFKSMWYRTTVKLPAVPRGRRVFLWLGSFDGSVKAFVNGQLVRPVGGKGGDEATGYCQPFSFDVTGAAREGANTVALFCTRKDFNELGTGGLLGPAVVYAEKAPTWLPATAHLVPKETAPEGEGYFSIIEGKNGRLYVGTHANGVNSWLVEFDPAAKKMKVVVDCHKAIGKDLRGFGSQAKIHTRNNVGASGKIYFGTKQGYPNKDEKREDYPGGYPMVYDPETGKTKVYPIPVPHQGINSITPDESRGVAYVSTCSDGRPGPGENSVFLVLDLKTGKYRELIDTHHVYGFIVLDHLGRAYHPLLGGEIARYDPRTGKLEKLKQTIDGQPPAPELHLADRPSGHPLNWDVAPDGKTLYCVPMSTNRLFAYDLTAAGDTLPGRDLGPLVPSSTDTDCRALCVGPGGQVWASVTVGSAYPGVRLHHLVRYRPGDAAPRDLGVVSIKNPEYTSFTDKDGKPLPFHGGTFRTPDGVTTSRYCTLGVCQTRAGGVYVLMLHPYTVLEIAPAALPSAAADWPQFRGPDCSGVAAGPGRLPDRIGPNVNVVWKTPLPPGHSSPVVVGDRVYLTAVRDTRLLTLALDRESGRVLWEREAPARRLEAVHKIGSHAQPTPAADGAGVVSFFGSCGLFAYDRDGKPLWHRAMGPFKNDFGAGSSPVLCGGRVLLCQDHDQDSFLMALDRRSGETLWKTDRSEFLRGYCTPVVWDVGGRKQVVVAGTLRVAGYDLESGKEVWTVRGIARTVCMTPVVGDDGRLYVAGWSAGGDPGAAIAVEPFDGVLKRLDKNGNGKLESDELTAGPIAERFTQVDVDKDGSITRAEYERFRGLFREGRNVVLAVRPGGEGDVTASHVAWKSRKHVPFCASPLYLDGLVYTVKDGGFLSALDARTGELVKRDRLPGGGNYYSSPVAGDGKIYLADERGRLTVVKAGREWDVLSAGDFGEDIYATPALVDCRVYVRTAGHLYCFGLPEKK